MGIRRSMLRLTADAGQDGCPPHEATGVGGSSGLCCLLGGLCKGGIDTQVFLCYPALRWGTWGSQERAPHEIKTLLSHKKGSARLFAFPTRFPETGCCQLGIRVR